MWRTCHPHVIIGHRIYIYIQYISKYIYTYIESVNINDACKCKERDIDTHHAIQNDILSRTKLSFSWSSMKLAKMDARSWSGKMGD